MKLKTDPQLELPLFLERPPIIETRILSVTGVPTTITTYFHFGAQDLAAGMTYAQIRAVAGNLGWPEEWLPPAKTLQPAKKRKSRPLP